MFFIYTFLSPKADEESASLGAQVSSCLMGEAAGMLDAAFLGKAGWDHKTKRRGETTSSICSSLNTCFKFSLRKNGLGNSAADTREAEDSGPAFMGKTPEFTCQAPGQVYTSLLVAAACS